MRAGKKYPPILQLLFAGGCLCLSLFAQSGRTSPVPRPSPEAGVLTERKKEYPACESAPGAAVLVHVLELAKLADELNKFGGCGYRLEHIFKRYIENAEETVMQSKFSGFFRQDGNNKYEYAWFVARRPGEAQTLSNDLAEKGFYLKKVMTFVEGACSESTRKRDKENKESGPLGAYFNFGVETGAIFLFEKKVGRIKKNEYRILDGATRSTAPKDNQKQLEVYTAKGFRPVDLWWLGLMQDHFVVMEKDDEIKPEGEYIYLNKALGTAKTLTRLARAGYRLVIMGSDFAVLNRLNREPLEIEYKAVPFYADLMKEFPKMFEKGIVEVKTGIEVGTCDVMESEWFFIGPAGKSRSGVQNKEYKLLTLSDFANEYAKQKGWRPGKKTRFTDSQFDELQVAFSNKVYETIKEGYAIEKFSIAGSMSILFERRKPGAF